MKNSEKEVTLCDQYKKGKGGKGKGGGGKK